MTNAELIQKIRNEIKRISSRAMNEEGQDLCKYLLSFLSTLESENTYDTQQYTPRPSVDIEDVARVQFASHAKVFDKKRKAVFTWEQFKEVAGIFYGFGKKDRSDTLEKSERPEPYNPVYDEAYLNEKIKKATESWKGVDVDAMLAECRGYDEEKSEKPVPNDLEEAAEAYSKKKHPMTITGAKESKEDFIAGYNLCKEQMMKEAVECDLACIKDRLLAVLPVREFQWTAGDKVRVIVCKKED